MVLMFLHEGKILLHWRREWRGAVVGREACLSLSFTHAI
jgi:hypothetical protein